jgi:hypothetical protein
MDVLATFLADCCLRGEDEDAFAGELWGRGSAGVRRPASKPARK